MISRAINPFVQQCTMHVKRYYVAAAQELDFRTVALRLQQHTQEVVVVIDLDTGKDVESSGSAGV